VTIIIWIDATTTTATNEPYPAWPTNATDYVGNSNVILPEPEVWPLLPEDDDLARRKQEARERSRKAILRPLKRQGRGRPPIRRWSAQPGAQRPRRGRPRRR